jgi:hypothetical protein
MRAGAVALRGDPASTHGGRHADHRPRGRTARPGRFESPSSTCESLCELTAMREVLPATHAPSPRRNPEAGCSAALNFARHRRFVTDSPLEGDGFELLVPGPKRPRFPKDPILRDMADEIGVDVDQETDLAGLVQYCLNKAGRTRTRLVRMITEHFGEEKPIPPIFRSLAAPSCPRKTSNCVPVAASQTRPLLPADERSPLRPATLSTDAWSPARR